MFPQLNGTPLPKFPWGEFSLDMVLNEQDGLLLILRRSQAGQLLLTWWSTSDSSNARWIYLPVSVHRLREILSGTVSLLEAMSDPEESYLYVVDVDAQTENLNQIVMTEIISLPSSHMPSPSAILDIPMPLELDDSETTDSDPYVNSDSVLDQVFAKLKEIAITSSNREYLYRGEPEWYSKVSSGLYRRHETSGFGDFGIEYVERGILESVRDRTSLTDDLDILSELQHYGHHTNLIDFTTDYNIALFFACDGSFDKDGRMIFLETSSDDFETFTPTTPVNRVIAQKSKFVRPRSGHVEPTATINIPGQMKRHILQHLADHHDITAQSIYNDLHGFIRYSGHHAEAQKEFGEAVVFQEKEDYTKAIVHYNRAIKRNPRMTAAFSNRGACYMKMGQMEAAFRDFNAAIAMSPRSAPAYCNRGLAHAWQGLQDDAIRDYTRAIELQPDHPIAYGNRGIAHYKQGNMNFAKEDLDKAIELHPDYADIHIWLGRYYSDRKEWNPALLHSDKAVELGSQEHSAYLGRGYVHYRLGHFDKALSDYDKAVEVKPCDAKAYNYRGLCNEKLSNPDKAIEEFTEALQRDSNYAEAYSNRGFIYYRAGESDLAMSDYNKAIEIDSQYQKAYTNRSALYIELGQLDLALADISKAIELNPDDSDAHCNRGIIYVNLQDWDSAISDFNKSIELNPCNTNAFSCRLPIWIMRKDWVTAEADYLALQRLQYDISSDFRRSYGSVEEMENELNVELPDNLKVIFG